MKHSFSVSTLTGTLVGSITFKGDKPVFTGETGCPFNLMPVDTRDLGRAALYLESETAAVSCTCNGYLVAKH